MVATDVQDAVTELKSNLTDLTTYSTTEQVVGKWINGKPLYRKTVDTGTLPNNNTKNVAHNISNLDVIVSYIGIAWNSGKTDFRIMPYPSTNDWIMGLYVSNTNITYTTQKDFSFLTSSYVTIEYTKTTD